MFEELRDLFFLKIQQRQRVIVLHISWNMLHAALGDYVYILETRFLQRAGR